MALTDFNQFQDEATQPKDGSSGDEVIAFKVRNHMKRSTRGPARKEVHEEIHEEKEGQQPAAAPARAPAVELEATAAIAVAQPDDDEDGNMGGVMEGAEGAIA